MHNVNVSYDMHTCLENPAGRDDISAITDDLLSTSENLSAARLSGSDSGILHFLSID